MRLGSALGLGLAVRVRVIRRIGLGVRHGLTLTFPVGVWRVSAREVKYRLQQGRVRVRITAGGRVRVGVRVRAWDGVWVGVRVGVRVRVGVKVSVKG